MRFDQIIDRRHQRGREAGFAATRFPAVMMPRPWAGGETGHRFGLSPRHPSPPAP
jgi:hypothetical protein